MVKDTQARSLRSSPGSVVAGLSRPRQARSQETLKRILRAAADALHEMPFDHLSVSDITRRAGVSAGSFYARFPEKDALLATLCDGYLAQVEAEVSQLRERAPMLGLEARVRQVVEMTARQFQRNRGVVRSMLTAYRQRSVQVIGQHVDRIGRIYRDLLAIVAGERLEQLAADQEHAVRFSVFLMVSALRERFVYANSPDFVLDDATGEQILNRLIEALTTQLCHHGLPQEAGREGTSWSDK